MLLAKVFCILFRVAVFVQQRNLSSIQPKKPFLFVLRYSDIADRSFRKCPFVLHNRRQFAVPLNATHPAQRKGLYFSSVFPSLHLSCEAGNIGVPIRPKNPCFDAVSFKVRNCRVVDEINVFRDFSADPFIEHDFTIYKFIKRFFVFYSKQGRCNAVLAETARSNVFQSASSSFLVFFKC